jgi:hypothetical protein
MDKNKEEFSSSVLDQGNRLDEEAIREIVALYEAELKSRTMGPQLEGFEGSQLAEALRNEPENVLLLDLMDESGEVAGRWPLIVPVKYHQDYNPEFFVDHYPDQEAFYLSLPPYDNIESLTTADDDRLAVVAEFFSARDAVLAFDYREGDDSQNLTPELLEVMLGQSTVSVNDVTPQSRAWNMDYGLPLARHYEPIARLIEKKANPATSVSEAIGRLLADGRIEQSPENGVTIVGREALLANDRKILNEIWDSYSSQFDELVEDHPALGKQPREEFEAMLLDEDTVNIDFTVDGIAKGLLESVSDIEKCIWLNKKYYDEAFRDKGVSVVHIPSIVVAKEMARQGAEYSDKMMDLYLEVVAEMNLDLAITFACSNVSSTYIPKIVKRAIDRSHLYNMDPASIEEVPGGKSRIITTAQYGYRILHVA